MCGRPPEHLQIDVAVTGVDRGGDGQRVVVGDERGGEGGQSRQADNRFAGGKPQAPRRGDADAHAGEAAGAGGDGDAIDPREIEAAVFHHAGDKRHQGFGMAARHRYRFTGDDSAQFGVEHGGRTGLERGVDGEDSHKLV